MTGKLLGQAKVRQLDVAVLIKQDISGLDVTVKNGLEHPVLFVAVALLQCEHDLRAKLPDQLLIEVCPVKKRLSVPQSARHTGRFLTLPCGTCG